MRTQAAFMEFATFLKKKNSSQKEKCKCFVLASNRCVLFRGQSRGQSSEMSVTRGIVTEDRPRQWDASFKSRAGQSFHSLLCPVLKLTPKSFMISLPVNPGVD